MMMCAGAMLLFHSCENLRPEMNLTFESDMSVLIKAIEDKDNSLENKLNAIEEALNEGRLQNQQAFDLVMQAIESLASKINQNPDTPVSQDVTNAELLVAINNVLSSLSSLYNAVTVDQAAVLAEILEAVRGMSDCKDILNAILDAIQNLNIPQQPQPQNGSHEYVEMGDGLKWAKCNLGADNPEDYGNHYAWGETSPKRSFTWNNYKWSSPGQFGQYYQQQPYYALTKYTVNDGVYDAAWYGFSGQMMVFKGDGMDSYDDAGYVDDPARINWGVGWRTPSVAEWSVLMSPLSFQWTWTDNYNDTGVAGMLVESLVDGYQGNSIFLPMCGGFMDYFISLENSGYWTSELGDTSMTACYFGFYGNDTMIIATERCYGMPVRAVHD